MSTSEDASRLHASYATAIKAAEERGVQRERDRVLELLTGLAMKASQRLSQCRELHNYGGALHATGLQDAYEYAHHGVGKGRAPV